VDRHYSSTRGFERRKFLGALAALELSPYFRILGDTNRLAAVIVVYVSGVDAYQEAVRGLREGFAKFVPSPTFIDLKAPNAEGELAEALGNGPQHVVISVGTESLETASRKGAAVIVPTMILRSDRPRGSPGGANLQRPPGVYLDLPFASLLSELKTLLPGKIQCGLIRNSSRDEFEPSGSTRVKQLGFTLTAAECSRPEDLVKSFLSLKGKSDFVVVFPDSSLYNNTTVRPLIQASLESRLPIVGFSSSFVRAGAAVGIYPDFRDVGSQAADVVQRLIAGRTGMADESPRKLQVAVNQRVLRLLGLSCKESSGLVIFR
jgi:putative ABC transport system substrate-binding protein